MTEVIDMKSRITSNIAEDTPTVFAKEVLTDLAAEADDEEYEHCVVILTNKSGDMKIVNSDLTRAECAFFLEVAKQNIIFG